MWIDEINNQSNWNNHANSISSWDHDNDTESTWNSNNNLLLIGSPIGILLVFTHYRTVLNISLWGNQSIINTIWS
jgi:hypothetical protein